MDSTSSGSRWGGRLVGFLSVRDSQRRSGVWFFVFLVSAVRRDSQRRSGVCVFLGFKDPKGILKGDSSKNWRVLVVLELFAVCLGPDLLVSVGLPEGKTMKKEVEKLIIWGFYSQKQILGCVCFEKISKG